MDRLTLSPEALAFVSEQRAANHAAATTEDTDLDPADRRDRAEVLGAGCRVQRDDDVLYSEFPLRVIGPARGQGWFFALLEVPWGFTTTPLEGQYITDRAPADPEDEPLPIFVEP